ncbi:MAG: porin family protein [Bacteroides sp.]
MKQNLFILFLLLLSINAFSQARKIQNRPYIDQRRIHYGFVIGLHTQDLKFENNGYITENGQSWFADVAEYSPGFTVGVLSELYLNKYLSARIIPSLHFGDKKVIFREQATGERYSQSMKSSYLSIPIDLKFSAERYNNYRPYIMAGINPMMDLSKKKQKALMVKTFDCMVEVGVGCDFYLPFFKLIPELKFCFGLSNLLETKRTDLTDKTLMKYTQSIDKVSSRMIVLSFYFE